MADPGSRIDNGVLFPYGVVRVDDEHRALPREARKVQITGKSTHIVSLPKRWVDRVNLRGGDMVFLVPRPDGTLVLNPAVRNGDARPRSLSIDITGQSIEQVQRHFLGAYLSGWQLIRMDSRVRLEPGHAQGIRALTHGLIGPHVVDESATSITFRVLADAADFTPTQGIRRMHSLVREMHAEAVASLDSSPSGQPAADIRRLDEEVNKLSWLIAKQCNLIMRDVFFGDRVGLVPQQASSFLIVARSIERIGDNAVRIAAQAADARLDADMRLLIGETSTRFVALLDRSVRAFYQAKEKEAGRVLDEIPTERKTLQVFRHHLLTNPAVSASTLMAAAHVLDSLDRSIAYCADVAEATIDHHYAREGLVDVS